MNEPVCCVFGKQVHHVCIQQDCQFNAFMCNQNCLCKISHQNCSYKTWKFISDQLHVKSSLHVSQIKTFCEFIQSIKKCLKILESEFIQASEQKAQSPKRKELKAYLKNDACYKLLSGNYFCMWIKKNQNDSLNNKTEFQAIIENIDKQAKKLYQEIKTLYQKNKAEEPKVAKTLDTSLFQMIKKSMNILSQNIILPNSLHWSNSLKATTISIKQNIVTQNRVNSSNSESTFALLQPALTQGRYVWSVKMIHEGMRVGICIKNKIIEFKFGHDGHKVPGHGAYVIGSGGYLYNHQLKMTQSKLKWGQGQIITMCYDTNTKILAFWKKTAPTIKEQMIIPNLPPGQTYHGCVYLFKSGWSAELILQN